MKKTQKKRRTSLQRGLEILQSELELALAWKKPSILFAVSSPNFDACRAQRLLQSQLEKIGGQVMYLQVEQDAPDVILQISRAASSEKTVYFVTGVESANQASNGTVYRALNLHRELIIESDARVVFWLTEKDAAEIPRRAPDFWAFRHCVVQFSSRPKRAPKTPSAGN